MPDPEQHVPRALSAIHRLAALFGYFALGWPADYKVTMGAKALTPESRRSSVASSLDHDYTGDSIQFGLIAWSINTEDVSQHRISYPLLEIANMRTVQ